MIKIMISVIVAVLFLSACSSGSKKDAGRSNPPDRENLNSQAQTVEATPVEEASPEAVEKEKPKPAPPAVSQYDGLNEAIRNQNDERIYNTATQILIQSPTDLKALNAMAMYNYKKGRFEVSRSLLSKAIAAHPKASELHSNLGVILLAQNEKREAIKSFRQALDLDSSDAVASANLGAIYVQEQDYSKALIVLETAYRKGMREPRVLNNYGIALVANKKYDKAEEIYKMAIKDQSSNKELLLNYAILLVDNLNKYQESLEILNKLKFISSSGGSLEFRNRLAALETKAKAGIK